MIMGKVRLSLTLSKGILDKIDATVDGIRTRNRSHAVELLVSKALRCDKPTKALILAGGKGTRMRPITYEMPKPMVPIAGKPVLEYTIALLRKHEVRDIIISLGYLGEKIKEHFGNGSKFGVNIKYIEENEPLGTAGPLKLAAPLIDDTFIMLNGDVIVNLDILDMYNYHKGAKGLATVALTTVEDPSRFGVMEMQGTQIVSFVEKPKKGEAKSNLINAGVYILEPEVIKLIPKGYAMMEVDVFPKLVGQKDIHGYPISGYWKDLGTLKSYEEAIKEIKERKINII